jgi:pimeloyl-ACP methyl ester carboxylesterase
MKTTGINKIGSIAINLSSALLAFFLAGCASAPMGADRVSPRQAYQQIGGSVLDTRALSSDTVALLQRYDLNRLVRTDPYEALRRLHHKAVETEDRDLLFALSELSFFTGERVRKSQKAWEPRDARDYYLGASVYAYLFLFGGESEDQPGAFDRHFRLACDLYNYGLGWALTEWRGTNATVRLEAGPRRLPVGEIQLSFCSTAFPWPLEQFEKFLVADQFRVRGLSIRNREAGVGAPLIAVNRPDPGLPLRRSMPATVFLRPEGSLANLETGGVTGSLELRSVFGENTVAIGERRVPLEMDLTVAGAHTLNQSFAWSAGRLQFFSADRALRSQLIMSEPYQPGRVPVILVHGTFSSPVKWGEMMNTLNADPLLRQRCQIWLYLYSSSKPLVISAAELRDALSAQIHYLDPDGRDTALQQMVVIGHSQGGLLAKMTATDSGDQLWHVLSDKPLEALHLSDAKEAEFQRLLFLRSLPFVRRAIFISTPHRGSYLDTHFARKLARRLIKLPRSVLRSTSELLMNTDGLNLPEQFRGRNRLNSLDGMAVDNPLMLKLAEIPLAPGVTGHSIIAVNTKGDLQNGRDGVVAYQSAHVNYVKSEFIVRDKHSCQANPATIEEVRRILHEHLESIPAIQMLPSPAL